MRLKEILYIYLVAFLLIKAAPSRAAIVFDGEQSYSTHTGKGFYVAKLFKNEKPGTTILLQDLYFGQIDYTTKSKESNRTNITDPKGMFIEAEGFYSYTRAASGLVLSKEGQELTKERIEVLPNDNYRLCGYMGGVIAFKIDVESPGTYRFALDAATKTKNYSILRLYAVNNQGTLTEASGYWEGKYITGGWNKIVENYGGESSEQPFFIDLYLEEDSTSLLLVSEPSYTTLHIDRLRVVSSENQPAASSAASKKRKQDDLATNAERHIPSIDFSEEQTTETTQGPLVFTIEFVTVILLIVVVVGIVISKKQR